jgi:hypothetical protein
MSPELGQAGLRVALFLIVCSTGLLFVVPRGTAEFAITVVTLVIGLLFSGLIVLFIRVFGR